MNATVVKFDALPDANRSAADGNESLLGALVHVGQAIDARGPVRFVGGVVIRCFRGKFSGARVDHAVHGVESDVVASLHHGALVLPCGEGFETCRRETRQGVSDVSVAEPVALPQAQLLLRQLGGGNTSLNDASFHLRKPLEAVEEPSVTRVISWTFSTLHPRRKASSNAPMRRSVAMANQSTKVASGSASWARSDIPSPSDSSARVNGRGGHNPARGTPMPSGRPPRNCDRWP